jgi:parallel beta-helix repeat protein
MKRLLFSLFVLGASLCLCNEAQANTFYVAPSGNNTNSGSQAQPWLTLQHAVDSINPGDTILVESGTYAGCRIGHSGQQGAACTLKSDSGASVLVNAPGPLNRHNSNIEVELFGDTVRYWVIDGFESANSPRYGVDVRITDFITVQNCYVHGSALTGIFLAFSDHPLIQNNESTLNGEHGIYDSNSGDYPTIKGNRSHHNHSAGIHMNGDRTQTPGDGIISFAVVEKNTIYENGAGGGSGINCDGVSDSIFRNNLLYNNHASGISLYAIDGAEGSSRNKVYNNTIIMAASARWCVNIPAAAQGQPDPTGNQVRNNILYTPDTVLRGSVLTYGSSVTGFASDYNIVVSRFSVDGGNSTISLAAWQALGYDQHSIVAAPAALFVDPAGNNYHLKPGSPAIGAGVALPEVTDDLDGRARPLNKPYATGCYEAPSAGIASAGLYDPAHAAFFLRNSNTGGIADITFTYGPAGLGLIPIVGDWDGDGVDTIGLYDPAHAAFFLRNSNTGGIGDISFTFGPAGLGFVPIVGDWNGDGIDTIGLYDPSHAAFFLRNSNSGGVADITFTYGPAGLGFIPIVGDWNGDGVDTVGLYDPAHGAFFLRNSNTGGVADILFSYGPGGLGFIPLVGDWNNDGVATVGLYDPAHAAFFLRNSNSGGIADIAFTYGPSGMGFTPIVGNWDGL